MELIDHIRQAQDGRFIALLGAAAGLDAYAAETLLRRQLPLIAQRIDAVAAADPAAMETLFDIVEEGEAEAYLEDIRALTSRAAVKDGEELLAHLFGSLEAARTAAMEAGAPEGVPPELAGRFLTYSAVLAVAAMSRRWRTEIMPALAAAGDGDSGPAGTGGALAGGLMATLVAALIDGLVKGLLQALRPRRRRRTRYARRYRRYASRGRTRRRRPSRRRRRTRRDRGLLEEILGQVLKG